jgi:hypothetical protein
MKSKDQQLLEEAYKGILLMEETVTQVRRVLNDLMNQDQKYNNPSERKDWQSNKVWPYIKKNLPVILADKKDNGNYPYAPYAAWLLVQHMDAFVSNQEWFLDKLEKTIPKFPKLKFLQDRVKVNQIIQTLYNSKTEYYNNLNKNYAKGDSITSIIRDSNLFPSADNEVPRSAKAAYKLLVRSNNNPLFVDALDQAYKEGVDTQPSYSG